VIQHIADWGETMTNRRELTAGLVFGVAALATMQAGGGAAMAATEAEALEALNPWADALFSGDPVQVEKVLAPEYQILRSDGTGYLKADYLNALPKQNIRSKFSNIVATAAGAVMVIRYTIETNQTINGKPVQAVGPRLSVFRKEVGVWLMSAHANFSKIG
jgi:hypothetical protein